MARMRWLAVGLAGSALACLLFVLVHLCRGLIGPSLGAVAPPLRPPLDGLLTSAVLGGVVALVAVGWARRASRALLRDLAGRVASLRDNPSPHTLRVLCDGLEGRALAPVLQEVTHLAGTYRQALAEVIRAEEALDQFQNAGKGTKDRPAAPTRYIVGSSRHRMVARLTPNLRWVAATAPLQGFLHQTGADLVTRPFLDHVYPEDVGIVTRALLAALKDGEGHNIIFRILAPRVVPEGESGEQIQQHLGPTPYPLGETGERKTALVTCYVQMDVMTYFDERGAPLHLRCHLLDVTSQVRTEQELRRRTEELSRANAALRQTNSDLQRLKESYRDLYHQAPVLYFSLDHQGRFVACNETMLRVLGYARDELLGAAYTRLLPPAGQTSFLAHPTMFHVPGEVETCWVKKDGTVIDVWIGTTTIRTPDGTFLRSRSAARDVTERRILVDALRAKAHELSLANAQLRRSNQELEEFTYVVSHDLKEPLRTLEAFSNFLRHDYEDILDEDGREYINHLIQGTGRLGALIDDLLRLSRAGRVIDTPRAFDWEELVRTVREDLADLIQRTGAAFRVEGPLPAVLGHPERIGQLLKNLVANGLKYNHSDRPEVVLSARGEDGGQIRFAVRDNGIGIDPAYHDQIFRLFRRLHRQDEVAGTGAGLAICRKIVEAHGGRLTLESETGRGATFLFTLPRASGGMDTHRVSGPEDLLAPEEEALPAVGSGGGAGASGDCQDGLGETAASPPDVREGGEVAGSTQAGSREAGTELLLVDDSPEFAFVVGRLGKKAGHSVVCCRDVAGAWEYLQRSRPVLILLDRNLTGENGLDLVRRLRGTPELATQAVALFCHANLSRDQAEALEAGVDFFFHKDLIPQEDAWSLRLREILGHVKGCRVEPPPLSPGFSVQEGVSWSDTFRRAWQQPALREVGPEVSHMLLEQALREQAEARGTGEPPSLADLSIPEAEHLFALLGERVERLLGRDAGQAFRAGLGDSRPAKPACPGTSTRAGTPPVAAVPAPPRGPSHQERRWRGSPASESRLAFVVLLVEDSEAEAQITRRAFRQCELPVELRVVRDGQEALDYLLRQGRHAPEGDHAEDWVPPILVLLDLNLPRLTGRDVLQRVRADPALQALPVVVLTNSRRAEDVRDLYAAGANTYIEKPRDFARFVEVIRTLLKYWLGTAVLPPPA